MKDTALRDRGPARFWTLRDIRDAMLDAAQWIDWEIELMNDFHKYSQKFGCAPGGNVFEFVLRDALRQHGLSLEQFRAERRR